MADEPGAENPQGGNPPAPTPTPITGSAAPAPTPEGDEFDKERAMATIKKLREFERTAKAQIKELETLRAEKEARDNASLTEAERLTKQLAEAEAKRQQVESELTATRRQGQVLRVAASLGAIDPQDANILAATAAIDPASDKAEEEVKAALEALKTSKPYLFKTAAGGTKLSSFNPGGAGGGPETDAQRIARIRRATGQTVGPFG